MDSSVWIELQEVLLVEDFKRFPNKDELGEFSDQNSMEFWRLLFYSDSLTHFFFKIRRNKKQDHW